MSACAEANCAMQDLTAITYNASDQHKEATKARQEWDSKDRRAIVETAEQESIHWRLISP